MCFQTPAAQLEEQYLEAAAEAVQHAVVPQEALVTAVMHHFRRTFLPGEQVMGRGEGLPALPCRIAACRTTVSRHACVSLPPASVPHCATGPAGRCERRWIARLTGRRRLTSAPAVPVRTSCASSTCINGRASRSLRHCGPKFRLPVCCTA